MIAELVLSANVKLFVPPQTDSFYLQLTRASDIESALLEHHQELVAIAATVDPWAFENLAGQ